MTIEHDPGKLGDLIVNIADAKPHQLGSGTTIRLLRYSEEKDLAVGPRRGAIMP